MVFVLQHQTMIWENVSNFENKNIFISMNWTFLSENLRLQTSEAKFYIKGVMAMGALILLCIENISQS